MVLRNPLFLSNTNNLQTNPFDPEREPEKVLILKVRGDLGSMVIKKTLLSRAS